ncbi:MAG: hypothetical protein M1820_006560 [Bogoriella megaspora]|nr:MAG: hypothetical protein M1820_006560 [Bogoriella megaspora]
MAPSRGRARSNKIAPDKKTTLKAETVKPKPLYKIKSHEVQQKSLDIFQAAFGNSFDSDFLTTLQEIKGHLYNRDFAQAFGTEEYLRVYAARWSPSRALGYLQIFSDILSELFIPLSQSKLLSGETKSEDTAKQDAPVKVTCLGAGAGAELVALAAHLNIAYANSEIKIEKPVEVTLVDIADWSTVVRDLYNSITQPLILSNYALAAAKTNNTPVVAADSFCYNFVREDVLQLGSVELRGLVEDASLITLMFTLNELYSTSLSLTQRFLLRLTECVPPGAVLLVVDSPGSYSTITLNGNEKKYPMHWLLDHTLVPIPGSSKEAARWEKSITDESKWFRLSDTLKYPIELENMRYQLHLYRRIGAS